jgi:hypothetical protein
MAYPVSVHLEMFTGYNTNTRNKLKPDLMLQTPSPFTKPQARPNLTPLYASAAYEQQKDFCLLVGPPQLKCTWKCLLSQSNAMRTASLVQRGALAWWRT